MEALQSIKNLLLNEGYTCVLSDGKEILTSRERGVKPLMKLIESGKSLKGYFAADKIVGKAAALLYALLGVNKLYAEVVSEEAVKVCKTHDISVSFGTLTEKIINRKGDGICLMEKTVADISDPQEAYFAVKEKLKNLGN